MRQCVLYLLHVSCTHCVYTSYQCKWQGPTQCTSKSPKVSRMNTISQTPQPMAIKHGPSHRHQTPLGSYRNGPVCSFVRPFLRPYVRSSVMFFWWYSPGLIIFGYVPLISCLWFVEQFLCWHRSGQIWPRQWLFAWRHQSITRNNVITQGSMGW